MGDDIKRYHLLPMDFETSGLKILERKHQPITCGMILADITTLEEIDRIYVECRLEPKSEWTKSAEDCHGLSYEYIMEQQSMEDAAIKIFEFFVRNGMQSEDYIMPLGHNIQFDIDCLNVWMEHIGVKLKYLHRHVNTFPLGYALFGDMNSNELFNRVGVVRNAHNSLEDAEAALNAVRFCRNIGSDWIANHGQ